MRTTLSAVQTKQLNNASSASPTGVQEQITGLRISTGLNSGDFLELTDAQAAALSDTAAGFNKLYAGIYQRVKFSAVTALAVGQACFWNPSDTSDPYCVTPVYAAGNANNFAGVVIDPNTTIGQYAWIQVSGKANCNFKSSIGNGSPAIGDAVVLTAAANTFEDPAANVTYNPITQLAGFIGVALVAPASSTTSLVDIKRAQTRF
jgi:hypothetical protein